MENYESMVTVYCNHEIVASLGDIAFAVQFIQLVMDNSLITIGVAMAGVVLLGFTS